MTVNWEKGGGFAPVVVQDLVTGQVLMVGVMNPEALALTVELGRVTFFSRTKGRLWTKGEESGNFLEVVKIGLDCDEDAILVVARPHGPTCHTGSTSCFGEISPRLGFLGELDAVVRDRRDSAEGSSYTRSLFESGEKRMAQKVGEEGTEVVIAALRGDEAELLNEMADLLYHLTVLAAAKGVSLREVAQVLAERHSSG
jgi:phosphoribosyl-ATP pyrophosphohydrolase/phosphoribosyl-AMP cyclohydrolase